MQAFSSGQTEAPGWTPPGGTLGDLTTASMLRASEALPRLAELQRVAATLPARPRLSSALRGDQVRVIAEVKRSSPSKGAIAPGLDAPAQAQRYVAGGAAAISVLTEPTRFGGSLSDLSAVCETVLVPVIRKDFIVAEVQLWEARAAGASAALLIARALPQDRLRALVAAASACDLEALVEIRDRAELARALDAGATIIGVNNRNLETLVIDPLTAPGLIPHIPPSCIAIAESGMITVGDVHPAARAGADAILVGSAVSASGDPTAAVHALAGVLRVPREAPVGA